MEDIKIKGLTFVQTCFACPEQYDVYDGDRQVGYVRLRHGYLTCEYPDVGGEEIYSAKIMNSAGADAGVFDDDTLRKECLYEIAGRLLEEMGKSVEMNYAVVFTYSFDDEMVVYTFCSEEEAKAFLKSNYEEELRIDREENGWDSNGEISEDGWYAKITTAFPDCDDVTEIRIGSIYR